MKIAVIPALCLLMLGCSRPTPAVEGAPEIQMRTADTGMAFIPNAAAFRMSGDYADNVAVTLNPDGSLAYYPAPSDIRASSAPVSLGDGWWLDRQGISANSVFTKWTFKQYSELDAVPSRAEIVDAIIPGARVTEMVTLPVTLEKALADPAYCRDLIPRQ